MIRNDFQSITATSPATATTTIVTASRFKGLHRYDWVTVDATLQGATGGTLDVYLQRLVTRDDTTGDEVWADFAHFPQLAAAAAAAHYTFDSQPSSGISLVGEGDATTAGVAIAVNTVIGGTTGSELRVVFVSGAGTSAGKSQIIRLRGWQKLA